MDSGQAMTVTEVADILSTSEQMVRKHLRTGLLKGFKIGSDWRVNMADLEAFRNTRGDSLEDRLADASENGVTSDQWATVLLAFKLWDSVHRGGWVSPEDGIVRQWHRGLLAACELIERGEEADVDVLFAALPQKLHGIIKAA